MTKLTDRDMLAWRLEVASGIVGHFGIADTELFQSHPGYERDLGRLPHRAIVDGSPIAVSPLGALIMAENSEGIGWVIPAGWARRALKYWSKYEAVAAFAQYLATEDKAVPGRDHAEAIDEWRRRPATTEAVSVKMLKSASVAVANGTFTPDSLAAVTA